MGITHPKILTSHSNGQGRDKNVVIAQSSTQSGMESASPSESTREAVEDFQAPGVDATMTNWDAFSLGSLGTIPILVGDDFSNLSHLLPEDYSNFDLYTF